MASLQQKRPSVSSVSNWFSSLRRQPKNKKSAANLHTADKQFQRSCIDLSSNSTFYIAPNAALHVTNKKSSTTPSHLEKRRNTTATSASRIATGVASTDSLQYDDDDRRGLVTGRRVSQLCSRCCCNVLAQESRSHTPPSPTEIQLTQPNSPNSINSPTTPKMPNSPNFSPSLDTPTAPTATSPYTSVAVYQIPSNTATSTTSSIPTTPTTSTLSSKTVISTDVSRDFKIMRLPSVETNTIVLNKKSELKRTTTTTTTRTLIISRPIELLLNEKGEVISRRRPPLEKKTRSNSLGCVLDDNDEERHDGDDADSCASYSPHTTGTTLEAVAGEGVEFRFIDDSSTSQSENERNSSQHNSKSSRHNDVNIYDSKNTTNNSYVGVGNVSGNNNNYELCEVCKNVIQLNRNNIAQNTVIMRNKQIKDELCEVVSEMEALDVPEDCKHSNKDKQMSIGRKKFNMDPKKGIEYLVENRLLRHDAQDVAHFLYKGEGLNKTAIGDYLGEKNDFNEDVLKAFVALHDFTNLILVQALRQFLWSFRLPGEAQKIDRMMECFAQRYCQLNPDIFTNTDTCYVLSFAIIMLNTSLHNPSVKDKPTVEQFISMNRGINNGGDLPRGLLESLYESIRTEPFKIPQDDGNDLMHTFFNPDKEGWLWKQGGRYKSWKRRWFILNDNCLYYFEYTTDKEPRGIIPLENISVREIHDRSKPHCFELFATGGADIIKACKTDSEGKVVEGKHTVYRMSAATEEDQQEWIKRLTQSISHNPFYDILVQRKKKALSKS